MPARVAAAEAEAQRLAGGQYRERLVGTTGNTPL
jgi:hypothetical protein